jgi:hypothetical protein
MNNANCRCPFNCKKHGLCEDCRANHKGSTFYNSPKIIQKLFTLVTKLQRKNND